MKTVPSPAKQSASDRETVIITLPDGSKKKHPSGITPVEIAKSISEGLARAALGALVDGKHTGLSGPLTNDAAVRIITFKDKEGKDILRHSCAHLLAASVLDLWPGAKNAIGPAIDNGFYQDFDVGDIKITEADFPKIEQKMREKLETWDHFIIQETSISKAKKDFAWNPYKLELIGEFAGQGKTITETLQGNFLDLCRGGHLEHPKKDLRYFKLLSVAGAYWRGDSKNKMLTRIYGTAFPSKKELDEHLFMLEEAKKRDHRKLGKDLELFFFHDYSPGSPFFYPKGTVMYLLLQDFLRTEYRKRGYQEVITPQLFNAALWKTSGHWEHYQEHMFTLKVEGDDFSFKPMNCPSHILLFKQKLHSYRELPIRLADFGVLHRNELSGVLSGLTRVRKFSQDDSHIFCTPEQVEGEIAGLLDFIELVYKKTFTFEYHVELSTRPDNAMGDPAVWKTAEEALERALKKHNIPYKINPGDGAFYGPKIDVHIKDAIGRTWQCATVQLDFQQPERFDVTYEAADGKKHRAVMIHRAILGSLERFIGVLTEHYAGKFPLWLSPVQCIILNVADRHEPYCASVAEAMREAGIRVELDVRSESISRKVREAQLQQINYILVVGDKEVESSTVNVRTRDNVVHGEMKQDKIISQLRQEITEQQQ